MATGSVPNTRGARYGNTKTYTWWSGVFAGGALSTNCWPTANTADRFPGSATGLANCVHPTVNPITDGWLPEDRDTWRDVTASSSVRRC